MIDSWYWAIPRTTLSVPLDVQDSRATARTRLHSCASGLADGGASRALRHQEGVHPHSERPGKAIGAIRVSVVRGLFGMADVHRTSPLVTHAAVREVAADDAARTAARAAGQAMAVAHFRTHSIAPAMYAAAAVHDAAAPADADSAVLEERNWQYQHLLELMDDANPGDTTHGAAS